MRFYLLILLAAVFSCGGSGKTGDNSVKTTPSIENPISNKNVPVYGYEVVNAYPHDKNAFTQGLVYRDGFLYESTGQRGESTLRKVDLKTGKVLRRHKVDDEYFAEGITILNGKVYQLTWQSSLGFIYNLDDFKLEKEFRYAGQGWGLTDDGKNLFMSDGTHVIRILDPETLKVDRTIVVMDEDGKPLMQINELEYIKDEIWANVWHSENIGKPNHVARISPKDGKLLGWINLDGISPDDMKRNSENVLNGIAYDKDGDRVFVTGKYWKKLFEIKVTTP
ncbi:MAG: glutaminyl-peptide cyclotransferase [Pyrinomonadaceae bacterium]|nr:glutaminyl-peptide cyclotransferase [Pyrinomonadaceae bacterium]